MSKKFWSNPFGAAGSGGGGGDASPSGRVGKCTDAGELLGGCNSDVNDIARFVSSANAGTASAFSPDGQVTDTGTNIAGGTDEADDGVADVADGGDDDGGKEPPRTSPSSETLALRLARIKQLLYDSAAPSNFAASVTEVILCQFPDLFPHLLQLMPSPHVPFEARKDITAIFNVLLTGAATSESFGRYVDEHYRDIMSPIVDGINSSESSPDTALLCGTMFRSTLRHEALYRRLLAGEPCSKSSEVSSDVSGSVDAGSATAAKRPTCAELYLYPLMDKSVFAPNFDAASDALATVRETFTSNKAIAAEFLEREYDAVFSRYNAMLQSENYITKRMSLKLLGEMLLDRSNFAVMMRYISSRENLRIVMCLLRDPSGNIQFEAFHVFKIFVANPNKPPEIRKTLAQNKVKLVAYLDQFHRDKEDGDEQFRDEKTLLISTLSGLEDS